MPQLRFNEVIGRLGADSFTESFNTIYFGRQGKDSFFGATEEDWIVFVGGSGDDTSNMTARK